MQKIIGFVSVDSGQIQIQASGFATAIVSSSGFGDGRYPVLATYKNCGTKKNPDIRIKSLTIKFID